MSEQADCPLPPPSHSALLHRWFIQYNPFYLVSAALVLYGLTTLSTAVASSLVTDSGLSHGALAQLGISASRRSPSCTRGRSSVVPRCSCGSGCVALP